MKLKMWFVSLFNTLSRRNRLKMLVCGLCLGGAIGFGAVACDPPEPEEPIATECWTDKDCDEGYACEGAAKSCPPGMYCILPAQPGTCEPYQECYMDKDCDEGEVCVGAVNCPDGAMCILPSKPGVCEFE